MSRKRCIRFLGWGTAATLAGPLSAAVLHFVKKSGAEENIEQMSVLIPAGTMVAMLIGFRAWGLRGFLVGPPIGFLAGFLDLKLFLWLMEEGHSVEWTALLPMWGLVLGIEAGCSRKGWAALVFVVLVASLADLSARWIWAEIFAAYSGSVAPLRWLLESISISVPSVAAVLLTAEPELSETESVEPVEIVQGESS
ncbi:MAG: hypothetical protein QF437_27235 [Planctomycetota bacterium]|jgi:hypothetical protein|nr:hypothetical protein [Planctomycetota bacterium]MDP7134223.1 hypothetical protein [Planctomycetota bacterium]MDP7252593.1 hypothetical protein [Planctomycetota bacterium]